MDEIGSEESFQDVSAIHVPMTSEERLLRRLSEVDRFVGNITAELQKSEPCKGVVSRELMERELGALNRDRESIEKKLGLLLPSFAVPPNDGSYEHKHGNSPPDIAPVTVTNANFPASARVGKGPERVEDRPLPFPSAGNRAALARTSSGTSPGRAFNAPPPSSLPEYRGEVASGSVGGGGHRGGREALPGGGSRKRPYSSALLVGERDQYPDSTRQGGSRRASAPSMQTAIILDADYRRHHRHHPNPDEQRPDRPRWAVVGSRARGHEEGQYQAGVGEPVQTAGATPPPPEGFFDRVGNQPHRFLHGTPDGVFRGRRRTAEPQVLERGASRARNRQDQGGLLGGSSSNGNGGRGGGLFRAPKIASLIRSSSSRQQHASPAHDAPPTRSPHLRATPRQLEGSYFRHGGGDREGPAHERERRLKGRLPFRQGDELSDTSSRSWHAAPPAWPLEEPGSEAGGARAAYGGRRVSVPVAMTVDVDNHHIDRLPHTDSRQSDYHQRGGVRPRHVDTSRVFDSSHRAGPNDHPDAKRFADSSRCPTSNSSSNQRYVDLTNNGYSIRPFDGSGSRAVDTHNHAANQAFHDNNTNNRYVDNHSSRQTPRRYSDVDVDVASRSGKRGRWCQQGQEPERDQRSFQAGMVMPRYPPRMASRVAASNDGESSGWAQEKLDPYSYSLAMQSPTH